MGQARSMTLRQKLFGPSRAEIWKQLSQQIDGTYQPGSFWKGDKVQVQHDGWTVTLDIHHVVVSTGKSTIVIPYTRFRAPYVNPANFRFSIYKKSFFSGIAKFMGMQDVEVGHPEFDDRFIIKGKDDGKLRRLFENASLRQTLLNQSEAHVSVKDDEGWFGKNFPADVDELQFVVHGEIKDVARLKGLFEAFAICLDALHEIGEATKTDPGVKL
jgi:hypothetical protein